MIFKSISGLGFRKKDVNYPFANWMILTQEKVVPKRQDQTYLIEILFNGSIFLLLKSNTNNRWYYQLHIITELKQNNTINV